jgi:hypothetical protein
MTLLARSVSVGEVLVSGDWYFSLAGASGF